ncbi:MGMT family protein [Marispirochaeta sp.]|uniref:MGMT family protein n=1 Tax=Marispirochaeta sp. TaxID=2038653 RepID=UPI0029C883A5|nr:MGMT family protein [Marispirochaeta sp.]
MSFSTAVIGLVRSIPTGKVASYGQIAAMAGKPGGARGVVWILRSSSSKHDLPWHRVVSIDGRIALKPGEGREEQISRLIAEGVPAHEGGVDMLRYRWNPGDEYSI